MEEASVADLHQFAFLDEPVSEPRSMGASELS